MNATPRARLAVSPGEPGLGLFRAIAEQWPGAVFVLNREGAVRWLNDAAHAWIKGDPEAVIGLPFAQLGLPWSAELAALRAAFTGIPTHFAPTEVIDSLGQQRFCAARLTPLRMSGTVSGALLFVDDAPTVSGYGAALPSPLSDTQRTAALSAAQVGSWYRDLVSGEAGVDPVWCDTLNLDACVGPAHLERWERSIHPDDVAEFRSKSIELQAGRASAFEVEYRILTRDSRWLWLLQRGRVAEYGDARQPRRVAGICLEIDARKRAEVALQANESRLATALWGARAAFWQWQITSDTAVRSPMWFAMMGYTRDEWDRQAQPWFSRVHPEDVPACKVAIRDHLEGRTQSMELEYRIRTATGEYKWMQDRGRVSEWDFEGNPTMAIGVSLDVDLQKRATLELRSSEARLETAIWGAKIGLWEMDFQTDHTRWHNDWCESMDLPPCEGNDHVSRWDSNIHPDDVALAASRFSAHVSGKSDHYDAEYRIRTAVGEWRWIFERGRVVERAPDGRALRMVGVCMDIEDRRAAEQGAIEMQNRLESALQHAKGAVWEHDIENGIVNSHEMYRQLLGVESLPITPAERHALWRSRMHPADAVRVAEVEARVGSGELDAFENEYRLQSASGEWRWILDRGHVVSRLADGTPARMAGFIMDATERVEMQLALRASEERYRLVSELTPGYIFQCVFDVGGLPRIVWASEGFRKVFGYSYTDIEQRGGIDQVFEPASIPVVVEFRERVQRGEVVNVDICVRDIAGARKWLRINARPVLDPHTNEYAGALGSAEDITASRLAEQARAQSDATLREVTANAPDWLMLLDTDLRMRFVNRAWLHFTVGDLVGKPLLDYIPLVNRSRLEKMYRAVVETGRADRLEVVHPNQGGGTSYLEHRVEPVKQDGRVVGLAVSVANTTQRRNAEAKMRETESVLRTIADVTSDWLLMLDRNMACVFINRDLAGRTPAELIGLPIDHLGSPIAGDGLAETIRDVMESGRPATIERGSDDSSSTATSYELRLWPVRDRDHVTGVVLVVSDISERRSHELALRTQARILDTMAEGVVLVEATTNIIKLTNPALDRIFGYERGATLGIPINRLAHRNYGDGGRLTPEERARVDSGESVSIEFDCMRKDGTRFIASSVVTPVMLGGVLHRLAVVADITERKHMEREILEISNREQQRMGSDLHDGLGQDLTGIALMLRGVAGQLRDESSRAGEELEEIIALVNAAIESTRTLARGLSPVTAERGGLGSALQALASRVQDRHGVAVDLRCESSATENFAEGAANHLYRIAQEALLNAIRHGQPTRVSISLTRDRGRIRLTVEDDGCGFDPARASSGLGLKIMRYRAQMLSGELDIHVETGGVRIECVCPTEQDRISA